MTQHLLLAAPVVDTGGLVRTAGSPPPDRGFWRIPAHFFPHHTSTSSLRRRSWSECRATGLRSCSARRTWRPRASSTLARTYAEVSVPGPQQLAGLTRHLHVHVDEVQQRSGDTHLVTRDLLLGTVTAAAGVAQIAARTPLRC